MSYLLKRPQSPNAEGTLVDVTPASAGWRYVGFSVHELDAGQRITRCSKDRETAVVLLSGHADVQVNDALFEDLGGRSSVFEDAAPYVVYAPANAKLSVVGRHRCEVALCSAPGGAGRRARVIQPAEIKRETRGKGTNTRHVRPLLADEGQADRLLIFEVMTPAGHWSSYPPHKHDRDALPGESALEETYYHRINPSQGFAFQRVYTDDRDIDETMTVHDRDLVLVPRGYHPVGAPHGYELYYLNVMAGPKRAWLFKNDPAHAWMLEKA